jgi:hypothetical protein
VRETKKKILVTILALAMAVLATPFVGTVMAKKPIIGAMDLEFNLSWPGPQADIPDWVGTVTIDSNVYGMAFFCIGSGKPFETDPGKVHFFEEIWVIYDYLEFDFGTQELNYGQILLWGYDRGVVSLANSNYVMNGNVEEAFMTFAILQGHKVHMSGEILWLAPGVPQYAPGVFRVN